MESTIKKPFFIALCAHLLVFTFIGFSFNPQLTRQTGEYAIVYLGQQVITRVSQAPPVAGKPLSSFFNRNKGLFFLSSSFYGARNKRYGEVVHLGSKPSVLFPASQAKLVYLDRKLPGAFPLQQKTPVFILHPILPAGFSLYFKDRQLAHVELSYRTASENSGHLLPVVKRKVSSGDLEVDLLCKRYITNYLFAQRLQLSPSSWQVVKIDLSGNDAQP